ncbi:MAG: EAL domain-containing protein [Pseudomonadota bacterium]
MMLFRGLLFKMLLLVLVVATISLVASYTFITLQQKVALDENIEQMRTIHNQASKKIFENLLLNQILPFTEEIIRLGGVDNQNPEEIEAFLRNTWHRVKLTFSFRSMSFAFGKTRYNFGKFPTIQMMDQQKMVQNTIIPQTSILCHSRCELATTVPVVSNKQTWSLSVLAEISSSIDLLSTIVGSDIILLLPEQSPNPNDKTIARYVGVSEYMTGSEKLSDLFRRSLTEEQLVNIENEGIFAKANKRDYFIWIDSLHGLGDELQLVYIRDITNLLSQRNSQQQQLFIAYGTLTIGVILFLMVFTIFPISRLSELKRAIKLIGEKDYATARERLGTERKMLMEDELDELEHEFRTAIDVLESYQKELDNSQKKLLKQATIDSTTGLFTRNVLLDDLENMNSIRHVNDVALFFLDLDGFKPVNDNLGHEAGDMMLKKIGYRLKGVISKFIRVYRIGGDEFVICVTNYNSTSDLIVMADEVIELFAAPFFIYETYISITASIGIAKQKAKSIDPENLLRYADIAMYQAKKDGKNRYRFFDESMRENTKRRFIIKNDFEQSLADGQLFVVFQPIVDAKTKRITKLEALCRWNHPTLGFIPPTLFIDVIEESESMNSLFEMLTYQVVEELKYLNTLGLNDIKISLNLSASQLSDDIALEIIDTKLAGTGISPTRIEIEITETSLITNFEDAKAWIDNAKKRGFDIAIDDFGAGYSSLSYLTVFAYDTVKLDRSLLNNIDKDIRQQRIVSSLTSMLKGLSVPTVAEGAETEEQYEELVKLGCNYIQGYLISKPITHEQLVKFLMEKNEVGAHVD